MTMYVDFFFLINVTLSCALGELYLRTALEIVAFPRSNRPLSSGSSREAWLFLANNSTTEKPD